MVSYCVLKQRSVFVCFAKLLVLQFSIGIFTTFLQALHNQLYSSVTYMFFSRHIGFSVGGSGQSDIFAQSDIPTDFGSLNHTFSIPAHLPSEVCLETMVEIRSVV